MDGSFQLTRGFQLFSTLIFSLVEHPLGLGYIGAYVAVGIAISLAVWKYGTGISRS
jgi:protein-S-isoprenylcysteine O-methyltransferase Ste14